MTLYSPNARLTKSDQVWGLSDERLTPRRHRLKSSDTFRHKLSNVWRPSTLKVDTLKCMSGFTDSLLAVDHGHTLKRVDVVTFVWRSSVVCQRSLNARWRTSDAHWRTIYTYQSSKSTFLIVWSLSTDGQRIFTYVDIRLTPFNDRLTRIYVLWRTSNSHWRTVQKY